jgi:hypothetical protein
MTTMVTNETVLLPAMGDLAVRVKAEEETKPSRGSTIGEEFRV